VVRSIGVIFLSWCCRHSQSRWRNSFGIYKGQCGESSMHCLLHSLGRTCPWEVWANNSSGRCWHVSVASLAGGCHAWA
jgi:hypothetical protein